MVCVAWVLGRGVLVATGTGANRSSVAAYTREDLGATTLELSAAEMAQVGKAGERAAAPQGVLAARRRTCIDGWTEGVRPVPPRK